MAKGSSPVQIGDILSIRYGHKRITVEVLQLMDNPRKEQASSLYRVLSEERLEQVNTHFVDDEE